MNQENKNCGESCGCKSQNEKDSTKKPEKKPLAETESPKKKLDPTQFGDWQINGRAIDF